QISILSQLVSCLFRSASTIARARLLSRLLVFLSFVCTRPNWFCFLLTLGTTQDDIASKRALASLGALNTETRGANNAALFSLHTHCNTGRDIPRRHPTGDA